MNSDARAGVAIRGDVGAKMPLLPWLAGALVVGAAALAAIASWLVVRAVRGLRPLLRLTPTRPQGQGPPAAPPHAVPSAGEHAGTATETIDVHASHLAERVRDLVHEGNVRRLVVKDAGGTTVLDAPVTVGVVGALAAPKLATLAALAAVATNYSIEVDREHLQATESVVAPT
jgi:hypothetical protein